MWSCENIENSIKASLVDRLEYLQLASKLHMLRFAGFG
jgi:hypothetical protein